MEETQEREWQEAQRIVFSVDLFASAKLQLKFLAAADKQRSLYDGPVLNRAINRYKNCWLPLLAKQDESSIPTPLLVPFDCEWIWHCHRLNPVQYLEDCRREFGRIMGTGNVISTISEEPIPLEWKRTWETEYPEEPFEITAYGSCSESCDQEKTAITYDLVSAAKRQISFFDQVSRPWMREDDFLRSAVERYKAFLHMKRRNQEQSLKIFQVPTYDIDLIWHAHQLHPQAYCRDLTGILGAVLGHDDSVTDRTKGKKLDVGTSETTKRWEEMYGRRYWRAGAMYKGQPPPPVVTVPPPYAAAEPLLSSTLPLLPGVHFVEVLLEIVDVRNMKGVEKAGLSVLVRKKQEDSFFRKVFKLPVLSLSGERRAAIFQCEPAGDLLLMVVVDDALSSKKFSLRRRRGVVGKAVLPLPELVDRRPDRCVDLWLDLGAKAGSLRVAASATSKAPGPRSLSLSLASRRWLSFQSNSSSTSVLDNNSRELLSIRLRKRDAVAKFRATQETKIVAEIRDNVWVFLENGFSLPLDRPNKEAHLYELKGAAHLVRLYVGRKLEFDPRTCQHHRADENDYVTAVRFSSEHPYGRAVALLNLRSALVKVSEDWFLLSAVLLGILLPGLVKY